MLGIAAAVLGGCTPDYGLKKSNVNHTAVTTGDFDDIVLPLDRMSVKTDSFEGLISVATWDDTYDAAAQPARVEDLLGNPNTMDDYDAILVASGTRGLGNQQYNGLDKDDEFVSDADTLANVADFVKGGGTLVVTDWAYDLAEQAWPDEITWIQDDTQFDDAQHGDIGSIGADVVDTDLSDALGMDTMEIDYDFSNWAVPQSVADDVTVWMTGDVSYTIRDGSASQPQNGAPLLMSFQPKGASGKVVVSTFHFDAQTPEAMDTIVETVIGKFTAAPAQSEQIGQ